MKILHSYLNGKIILFHLRSETKLEVGNIAPNHHFKLIYNSLLSCMCRTFNNSVQQIHFLLRRFYDSHGFVLLFCCHLFYLISQELCIMGYKRISNDILEAFE